MTTVGREDAPRRCDIILHGPGMAKEHCVIKYTDNGVYLQPHFQALCAVNGADISSSTKLTQGVLFCIDLECSLFFSMQYFTDIAIQVLAVL